MNTIWKHLPLTVALLAASTPGLAQETAAPGDRAYADPYSVARGGRLYDNWFKEKDVPAPTRPNPAYPAAGAFSGKKGADWRCKECHGWDYIGARGIYGKGEHQTGFPGIERAYLITPQKMAQVLGDRSHGYSPAMLSEQDVRDLAAFTARGVVPMDHYIHRKTRVARGNPRRGGEYYRTVCATCHGLDGKGEDTPPLGALAWENPWEMLHKILNGQPGHEMPALRAFGVQPAADVISYAQQSLPRE